MSDHNHIICEHEIKYCSKCDVCYCSKCTKEWSYLTMRFSQPTMWYNNSTMWEGDGMYPTITVNHTHEG